MANINIYAFLIYAFLASDEASYITGALWLVDGDIKCLRKRWWIVPVRQHSTARIDVQTILPFHGMRTLDLMK